MNNASASPLSRAAVARAAGLHSVADALAAEDAANSAAVNNAPRRATRRLRYRAKPLTFQWKKTDDAFDEYREKKVDASQQLPSREDFMQLMQKEQNIAKAFQAEMDVYKKYANPANIKSVDGARPACGRRSLALLNSGSSSFQKVSFALSLELVSLHFFTLPHNLIVHPD